MARDLTSLSAYQYDLPKELIAQHPCAQRDHSRLLVVDRQSHTINEIAFHQLPSLLNAGDNLIFNDTKVIPARLVGTRPAGGQAEIFLLRKLSHPGQWEALARPGKKLSPGTIVTFAPDFHCHIIDTLQDGSKIVQFEGNGDIDKLLDRYGRMPLPPYIERQAEGSTDSERYQTVYAKQSGAVAAPTAGLHFTPELLKQLKGQGVEQTFITLHVGLGTFRPVQVDDIKAHKMHSERFHIDVTAANQINHTPGRRICVGTTSCRTIESSASEEGIVKAGDFETEIFIYPGVRFKATDALLTNFHLPGSTLLMLVAAFAGYDLAMEAYQHAVQERFRFFSYGDAMLII